MPDSSASSDQSSDSPRTPGWGFWLSWALACMVGWGVGGQVGVALSPSDNIIVTGYLALTLGGILAGVFQSLVLRPHTVGAGSWVGSSITAAAVVGALVFGVGLVNADVGWVGGVGLLGAVLGVLQWRILRSQYAGAGWWVLACTVGWIAGGPAAGFLSWLVGDSVGGAGGGLVDWGTLGAVYGAITGAAMVWLLRRRLPGSEEPSV